jgi:outer membrane protein assembly factor BamC
MIRQGATALAAALTLALSGCASDGAKVDYKAEKKLPPLDIPPDLTTPPRDDRYQIPDSI